MYTVYKAYSRTFDREYDTWEEVMAFIARKAGKCNYGHFRKWNVDNEYFFDCGPIVYLIIPDEASAPQARAKWLGGNEDGK